MKYFTLFLLFFSLSCQGQQKNQIIIDLDYFPDQKENVSDQSYHKAINILKITYDNVKNNSNQLNYADHINLATAFVYLKEPKSKVLEQFEQAKEKGLEETAELFPIIYSKESLRDYFSSAEYDSIVFKYKEIVANKKEEVFDLVAYTDQNQFDYDLVKFMADLAERDQRHRKANDNWENQNYLDSINILSIDSLFKQHKKYIGKSMVGEKFSHTMWAVIQHSELEQQEFYLPIVHKAVQDGDLKPVPLGMLIDRIYLKKYGYQIFGSQSGVDLADDETIQKVKFKYGL
ncbi:hypothetical protein [Anditalea andensis]|uniref:Uncharacterized protein n=1 Tax=Anditalea andensis TaxID=1048983 RepID=A0A074KZJ1_9BACT|nr:hypothetical protein [Anditalea andensis]KEO75416.1 hypothetical protein EL17_00700 [Anditalea andensis]